MNTLASSTVIISLIRDSLVNYKLTTGLNALGLNADDYHVYLPDTIFKLMELENIEEGDLVFEKVFLANAQKVKQIQFPASSEELNELSEGIYEQLLFAKGLLVE
jgi:hypothetical protein